MSNKQLYLHEDVAEAHDGHLFLRKGPAFQHPLHGRPHCNNKYNGNYLTLERLIKR